jgi:hypothetical protein
MADIKLKKFVNNLADATATAPIGLSAVSPGPVTTGWPVGDTLVRELILRVSGIVTISLAGSTLSVLTQQMPRLIQNQIFGTNLHQNFVELGMDGLSLFRMLSIEARQDLFFLDIPQATTTTAPFEVVYRIPLGDANAARYWDTVVDILTAQPYLRRVYNAADNGVGVQGPIGLMTGGAGTIRVTSLNIDATVSCVTGPFTDSAGKPSFLTVAPKYQPYWDVFPVSITATRSQFPIYLPYGDRNIEKIFIFQRDPTLFSELNNTICGVNDQDRLSLKLNGLPIIDNMEFLALQNLNKHEYAPATLGAGTAVIDFHEKMTDSKVRGARLSNDLNVITPGQQKFELDIDVTKPGSGNPFLYIGMKSVRALNQIAKRPEQTAPPVAAASAASQAGK